MIVLFPLVGFWFWFAWVVAGSWLFAAVYSDRYFQATLDLVLLLALLSVTGNIRLAASWQYALHNPGAILGGAVAYLAVGVAWSLIKWRLLLRRLKLALRAHGFKPEHWLSQALPVELERQGLKFERGRVRLEVDDFKAKIVGWMTYWWVSMLLWVFGDAVHDLFEALYFSVRSYYQRVADSALNE